MELAKLREDERRKYGNAKSPMPRFQALFLGEPCLVLDSGLNKDQFIVNNLLIRSIPLWNKCVQEE